jgi:hypothetical protein
VGGAAPLLPATHIGAAVRFSPAHRSSRGQPSSPPAPRANTAARPSLHLPAPPKAPNALLLHPPKLAGVPILPAEPHHASTAGSRGHRAWPPAPPLAGFLPTPSNPRNRPLGTQGPSPARARPAPAGGWLEFGRTAAARPPGTTLQRRKSSQGPCCKSATPIVKVSWLILVNCIENRRKIRKIQGQFCWIRCELSYNFCYSGLS